MQIGKKFAMKQSSKGERITRKAHIGAMWKSFGKTAFFFATILFQNKGRMRSAMEDKKPDVQFILVALAGQSRTYTGVSSVPVTPQIRGTLIFLLENGPKHGTSHCNGTNPRPNPQPNLRSLLHSQCQTKLTLTSRRPTLELGCGLVLGCRCRLFAISQDRT